MLFRQTWTFVMGVVALALGLFLFAAGAPLGVWLFMGIAAAWSLSAWVYLLMDMPTVYPRRALFWVMACLVVLTIVSILFGHYHFSVLFGLAWVFAYFCDRRASRAQD